MAEVEAKVVVESATVVAVHECYFVLSVEFVILYFDLFYFGLYFVALHSLVEKTIEEQLSCVEPEIDYLPIVALVAVEQVDFEAVADYS